MTKEKTAPTRTEREFRYSEDAERDRRFEERYDRYCESFNIGQYASARKHMEEMGRVLPKWNILPPADSIQEKDNPDMDF